jgi:electron transport complex protein RnfD
MFDVVIAMLPVFAASLMFYHGRAIILTVATVAACLATEAVANLMRGRKQNSLLDGSAVLTGMILAFSLPPSLPAYMAAIGGVVGIALGKMIFGGLGQNLFNPAMVGRAFLMACFPVALTTWVEPSTLTLIGPDAVTKATPLAVAKFHSGEMAGLWNLFVGRVGGSLGETSALACLIGGIYLLVRKTADWRQPAGMLAGVVVFAAIAHHFNPDKCAGVLYHLNSGALMFGAFFIATDYVGAPITPKGRFIFGVGVGLLTMVVRLYGGYPEGVMFAVLMMNALTPLIERWTVPEPFGGRVPVAAK